MHRTEIMREAILLLRCNHRVVAAESTNNATETGRRTETSHELCEMFRWKVDGMYDNSRYCASLVKLSFLNNESTSIHLDSEPH